MDIALFLAGSSVGSLLVTQIIKGFFTKWINPRFKPLATQIILFMVCVIIAFGGALWAILPANVTSSLAIIFSSAIAIYEILKAVIVGKK